MGGRGCLAGEGLWSLGPGVRSLTHLANEVPRGEVLGCFGLGKMKMGSLRNDQFFFFTALFSRVLTLGSLLDCPNLDPWPMTAPCVMLVMTAAMKDNSVVGLITYNTLFLERNLEHNCFVRPK